jgi:hypothetical protein
MRVRFELHTPPSKPAPMEYVSVALDSGDVVHRPATDNDRVTWATEYAAFCSAQKPAPAPDDQISAPRDDRQEAAPAAPAHHPKKHHSKKGA